MLGVTLGIVGILLCLRILGVTRADLTNPRLVRLGVATLPRAGFLKLLAFVALVLMPAAVVAVANYHVFEGVEKVRGCASCHIMRPMVNDMRDAGSNTLAARHFRNRWIVDRQCYECHTDYGLSGALNAKMEGPAPRPVCDAHVSRARAPPRAVSQPELPEVPPGHGPVRGCPVAPHRVGPPPRQLDDLSQLPWPCASEPGRPDTGESRMRSPHEGARMNLTVPAIGAIVALVITTLFVASPSPHLMALFAFVAQPLFLIVALLYLGHVFRDLREKDIL